MITPKYLKTNWFNGSQFTHIFQKFLSKFVCCELKNVEGKHKIQNERN